MEHRSHGIPTGTTWGEWENVAKKELTEGVLADDVIDVLRHTPSAKGPHHHMEMNRILPEQRKARRLTPRAQTYFDLWIKLDDLFLAGKGGSPEFDAICDQADIPWYEMTTYDKELFREAVRWSGRQEVVMHPKVVLKTCKHAPADVDLHICPYAEDVNHDTTPCNCCDECMKVCADEI